MQGVKTYRYNELMAFMLSWYFWVLLVSTSAMRQELLAFLLMDRFDGWLSEMLVDLLLVIYGLLVLLSTLPLLFRPFTAAPNVRVEREANEAAIWFLNLGAGVAYCIHLYQTAFAWYDLVWPIGNALVVIAEFNAIDPDRGGEQYAPGECRPLHGVLGLACVATGFLAWQLPFEPHWSASLSQAAVAAAMLSWLLTRIFPLQPMGSRVRHAYWFTVDGYHEELGRDAAAERDAGEGAAQCSQEREGGGAGPQG